jgi:hypothetical protein
MNSGTNARHGLTCLVIGLLALAPAASASAASPDLQVTPNLIHIWTFFNGTRLTVSAKIPRGAEAVAEVVGESRDQELLRKGRRVGVWMTVGEVEVQNAPSVYLAMSTAAQLFSSPVTMPWGYGALGRQVSFTGRVGTTTTSELFRQFIRLKSSEGLYGLFPGALKVVAEGDRDRVQGTFRLPTKIAPGTYLVHLTVIRKGQRLEHQSLPLQVVMVGSPAIFHELAYQHGAIYGILAVVIAIFAGFVIGLLFKGRGGGH